MDGDSRVVQIEFALGDFDETPIAVAEDQARQEKESENSKETNKHTADEGDDNADSNSNSKFLL